MCAYPDSIEDAKQKTEHDRMVKQAEIKKQAVRRDVGRLRRIFLQLQQRNSQLPSEQILPPREFIMGRERREEMREGMREEREGEEGEE